MPPSRVFLGWEAGFLERVAAWVLDAAGATGDLGAWVLVLPGARAQRRLEDLLARRAPPAWIPPRCVTLGALPQLLSRSKPRLAPLLARELAWVLALKSLAPEQLAAFCSPAPSDLQGWLLVARRLMRWDEALAREGWDASAVAALAPAPFPERERARWLALAEVAQACERTLETNGWTDPARAAARAATAALEDLRVVLMAPTELARTQRKLLAALAAPPVSLVLAPESLAAGFDELGVPLTGFWLERELAWPRASWQVCHDNKEAGSQIVAWLADVSARTPTAPEQVTLGVLREDMVPFVARELAAAGVTARHGAGLPVERLAPVQLLRLTSRWLRSRSFEDLAALVRHPELEEALQRELAPLDPVGLCDAYERAHLPASGRGPWLGQHGHALQQLSAAVERFLGPLAHDGVQAAATWAHALRSLLLRVYADLEEDPTRASQWLAVQALRALAEALAELDEVAATPLAPATSAADLLELVLERLRSERAAAPPRAGAIELLGWLELLLDDAPQLFVAGLDEGSVPELPGSDGLLTRGLCERLGVQEESARVARDAYITAALRASRPAARFSSTRRDSAGNPLRPSRLVFHCAPEQVPARVQQFFGSAPPARVWEERRDGPAYVPPRDPTPAPEVYSVTDFKAYLDSPYRYYLERVEGLVTVERQERELDALAFGLLAHDVLQEFGTSQARESQDAREIATWLGNALDRRARSTYGVEPLPAVRLQIEQLRHRLEAVAARQARMSAEGWRIEHVELPSELLLDVDGRPVRIKGRIDRIDRHRDGRWRILDYKTGDHVEAPGKALRKGVWHDLQLPLYRELTRALWGEREPELGYFVISKEREQVGFVAAGWTPDMFPEALERAREVVRRIRAAEFADTGVLRQGSDSKPVLAALAGCGLLDFGEDEEQEGEEEA